MDIIKTIEELHEMLVSKKITSSELVKESVKRAKEINKVCNAFVTILDDAKK